MISRSTSASEPPCWIRLRSAAEALLGRSSGPRTRQAPREEDRRRALRSPRRLDRQLLSTARTRPRRRGTAAIDSEATAGAAEVRHGSDPDPEGPSTASTPERIRVGERPGGSICPFTGHRSGARLRSNKRRLTAIARPPGAASGGCRRQGRIAVCAAPAGMDPWWGCCARARRGLGYPPRISIAMSATASGVRPTCTPLASSASAFA